MKKKRLPEVRLGPVLMKPSLGHFKVEVTGTFMSPGVGTPLQVPGSVPHAFSGLSHLPLHRSNEGSYASTPISQGRKPRLREAKRPAQSHTAGVTRIHRLSLKPAVFLPDQFKSINNGVSSSSSSNWMRHGQREGGRLPPLRYPS